MSNGDPPPDSAAPYIIICSGRIAVEDANTTGGKIVAASECAARFAAFMQAYNPESESDIKELAAIQHFLMVHQKDMSKAEAEAKIQELIDKMTEIDGEYP